MWSGCENGGGDGVVNQGMGQGGMRRWVGGGGRGGDMVVIFGTSMLLEKYETRRQSFLIQEFVMLRIKRINYNKKF